MKKLIRYTLLLTTILWLTGCGQSSEADKEAKEEREVIKVATQLDTGAKILDLANKEAEKHGYTIETVRVNDNVQYNTLLNNKEIDANFAQHEPYMNDFNAANKGNLVIIQKIYDAKVGFYSKDYKNINDLPNNGKVALPNDPSNQGRALAILQEQALITLPDNIGFEATIKDITENPKNFQFLEIDLANLASAYDEKDIVLVYNYPTYLKKINLTPNDALFLEKSSDNHFAISLVAREDNKDSEKIKVLKEAMTSDAVKKYLTEDESDSLVPSF